MNIFPFVGIGAIVAGTLAFFYSKGKAAEKSPISYTQFMEQLGKQIDQYMLDEEKKTGVIMAGGECEISIPENDPDNVVMSIVLYSKKSCDDETWIKSNITQKLSVSEFANDPQTRDKLENLKNKTEKFKVTRPEKE